MPRLFKQMGRAVERVVGSDIHEGEWRLVLLFFANLFLLLTAYYVLKVIREPLILLGGGAVSRSYARGLQAALLFLLIPIYSAVANRVEPARLVVWIMGVFVVSLASFFVLGHNGVSVGFAFFVWLGLFSTLSIAQFWSLANDVMTESEGRRLFPLIAAGGTIGGIAGAQIAARAIAWLPPFELMLLAAGLVAVCLLLTHSTHRVALARDVHEPTSPRTVASAARDRRGGFTLVLRDRYLLLIALSVLLLNLVNTTGDFVLAELVEGRARAVAAEHRRQFIGAFYGDFQTWVSALTALVQVAVVGRIFRAIGVGGALFFLPLIAVGGYGLSAAFPVLGLVAAVKVIENSTDYSLQNTIQQALFLPTSRDAKYKAKSAIDTVSVRLGDLVSTALVVIGAEIHLGMVGFAIANVGAGLVWVWVALKLRRRQLALVSGGSPSPTPPDAPDEGRTVLALTTERRPPAAGYPPAL